jgi:hypothetical protein
VGTTPAELIVLGTASRVRVLMNKLVTAESKTEMGRVLVVVFP